MNKHWILEVLSPANGNLQILRDGLPLPLEVGPGLTSPVELLLASIGSCFALSCWAALSARNLERVAFRVRVRGTKASQPPSRLSQVELDVQFANNLPPDVAQAISRSAEQLCTVSNTVISEPSCAVGVHVSASSAT